MLGARIRAAEVAKRQQAEASTRRNLLGSGDRSDRNRTYNFPQGPRDRPPHQPDALPSG